MWWIPPWWVCPCTRTPTPRHNCHFRFWFSLCFQFPLLVVRAVVDVVVVVAVVVIVLAELSFRSIHLWEWEICLWVSLWECVRERERARANSGSNQGLSFRLLVCVFWQFNYVCWCVLISVCWPHGICARRKHEQTRRIVCSCAFEAGRMGYYD